MIPTTENAPWWERNELHEEPHKRLVSLVKRITTRQEVMASNTRRCMAIYQWGNKNSHVGSSDMVALDEVTATFNAARNVIDTAATKVCKSRIEPMPMSNGGGYLARRRAKDMGHAIVGEFDDNGVDAIKEDVVLDALVSAHGAGAAIVFAEYGRVKIEHVPIEDVWFDEAEVRHRNPRCMYLTRRMDRYVLAKLAQSLGAKKEVVAKVLNAPRAKMRDGGVESDHDQIEVIWAWHLPSAPVEELDESESDERAEDMLEANVRGRAPRRRRKKCDHDGRFSMVIEGATIVDEEYERSHFPVVMYVPRKRRRSVWGLGMMFDLVAPQREYERLGADIQNAHQAMGMSGFTAPRVANVDSRSIANVRSYVVEYDGDVGPQSFTPQPVHPDQYAYFDSIPRNMMASKGISQLAAQSQLPAGLQQASGKALQVFEDFESERLLFEHRELERWFIALAWLVAETAAEIVEDSPDYAARYRDRKGFYRAIKWRDVLMDRREGVITVFPVSSLAKSPAAKFEQLVQLLNVQAITTDQFKRLYDLPDLEDELDYDTALVDVVDAANDKILLKDEYTTVLPFDPLELIVDRTNRLYAKLRASDEPPPESRMKMLRDRVVDAEALLRQRRNQEAAAAQGAQAAMAGTMPADPAAQVAPLSPAA